MTQTISISSRRRWGQRMLLAPLIAALVTPLLGQAAQAAISPKADYRFLNSMKTSAGTAPNATNILSTQNCDGTGQHPNTFAVETVDGRKVPVLDFPRDNGVEIATSDTGYTIVALFRIGTAITGDWRRILDFKHSVGDPGVYIEPDGKLDFYNYATEGTTVINPNTWVQFVLTRNASTHVVTGYLDGSQQFQFTDSGGVAIVDSNHVLRFFHDNDSGGVVCEDTDGAVARIRLYNAPLSSSEVAALDRLPKKQAIALNPASGSAGSQVTVTGSNLGPGETVTITFIDANGVTKTNLGTVTTAILGSFTKTVTIPVSATLGTATIQAKGGTSKLTAKKSFQVT